MPRSPALVVGVGVFLNMGLGASVGRAWTVPCAVLIPLLALPTWDADELGWAYWAFVATPAAAALILVGLALRRLADRSIPTESPQSQRL